MLNSVATHVVLLYNAVPITTNNTTHTFNVTTQDLVHNLQVCTIITIS